MRVQKSIEIAAPPEKVWPFLTDPEKILQWCITLQKFEFTGEQRSGVGIPLYFEEKTPVKLMKVNFATTEWVENQIVAFSMTSGDFAKNYMQRWAIETTPSGSRFTFMEDFEFPYGVLGKILGFFGRFSSQATVGKMLALLKGLAEQ